MKPITNKQLIIYEALEKFISDKGYSPTVDELAHLTNHKAKSTVYEKLKSLKLKGYVTWENGHSRTLRIIKSM